MEAALIELGLPGGERQLLGHVTTTLLLLSPCIVLLTSYVPGPYGRFSHPSWGPAVGVRLAWCVQEVPSFLIPALLIAYSQPNMWHNPANRLLTTAFTLHYFQRSFIYPFLIRPGKPTPLVTHLLALSFVTVNGYLQARYHLHYAVYPAQYVRGPNIAIGLFLFTAGMFINLHSDHILRNLRRPGETGYKIPKGGLFEYVSCANYLGELVEWSGYALASWSLPALAFAVFTASNLVPRARAYHRNYQLKFDDYPKSRKAIIPFIL